MNLVLGLVLVLLGAPPSTGRATKSGGAKASAKSAPKLVVAGVAPTPSVAVLETIEHPTVDYQVEVYAGVPLDDAYAKERGVDKGLVRMVFEKQRRLAYRVAHEKIRKRVRFTGDAPRDFIDVLDTEDGFVVVETTTSNAGIFTWSDVYVFQKSLSLEQRLALVTREHVRQAMVAFR